MRDRIQTVDGFAAACVASVLIAFLSGCLFAVFVLRHGDAGFITRVTHDPKKMTEFLLMAGGMPALVTVLCFPLIVTLIARPLYFLATKNGFMLSLRLNIAIGLMVSSVVDVILAAIQNPVLKKNPELETLYLAECAGVFVAALVSAVVIWFVTQRRTVRTA